MKRGPLIVLIIIIIIVVAGAIWLFVPNPGIDLGGTTGTPTSTNNTSSTTVLSQSISDGTFTISFPENNFGLATNERQILVDTNIPPCSQGFNYCIYYTGTDYQNTNFESAGIRIEKRADLTTERLCLNTPPQGYNATKTPDATSSSNLYAVSVFKNIGGAAAGHIADGNLYRIFYRKAPSCYEFETRIGQTNFSNFQSGTIQQFTTNDQAALQAKIDQILDTLMLPASTTVSLPS